jgi:hypothetical protein
MSERSELIRDTVRYSPRSGESVIGATGLATPWVGRTALEVRR